MVYDHLSEAHSSGWVDRGVRAGERSGEPGFLGRGLPREQVWWWASGWEACWEGGGRQLELQERSLQLEEWVVWEWGPRVLREAATWEAVGRPSGCPLAALGPVSLSGQWGQ